MPDLPPYAQPPEPKKKRVQLTTTQRGYGWDHQRQRKTDFAPLCARCGVFSEQLHHKDGDPWNRAKENIEWLCQRCHIVEHHQRRRKH